MLYCIFAYGKLKYIEVYFFKIFSNLIFGQPTNKKVFSQVLYGRTFPNYRAAANASMLNHALVIMFIS